MKRKIAKTLMLILMLVMAFGLVACTPPPEELTVAVLFDLGANAADGQTGYEAKTLAKDGVLDFATITNPTAKTGYVFKGWQVNGTIYNAPQTLVVSESITVKAVFELINYTVTFQNAEGAEITSLQIAYGTVPTAPEFNNTTFPQFKNEVVGSRDKFSGWTVDGVATELVAVSGNITYVAAYTSETLPTVTVTFDLGANAADGQTGYEAKTLAKDGVLDFATITNPTAKTGYVFKGWQVNGTIYNAPQTLVVSESITVTAVFELINYTVTFQNAEGAEITSLQIAYGTVPTAPEFNNTTFPQFKNEVVGSRDKFSGWTVDGVATELVAVSGNITYVAAYTSETLPTVAVTFDLGANAADGQTGYEAKTLAKDGVLDFATITNPTAKTGYVFKGWQVNGTIYNAPQTLVVSESITVTAVFELINYTVTFQNAEGAEITSLQIAYGTVPTAPEFNNTNFLQYINVTNATRDKFSGWTVGGVETELGAVSEDITYVANYIQENIEYTLTLSSGYAEFYVNGKAVDNVVGNYQQSITFTVKLKTGVIITDGVSFKVMLGEEQVALTNNAYSVILSANSTITIGGVEWAKYDTIIKATDAEIDAKDEETGNANANYGVERGQGFRFKAKGKAGFTDNAPIVTYRNLIISAESKDLNGWYVFFVENITSVETLTVKGAIDYFTVQYVQVDGSILTQNWDTRMGAAGRHGELDTVTRKGFYPNGIYTNAISYALVETRIDRRDYSYLTKSAAIEDRVVTAEQASAWVTNPQFFTPVKGEENIFYLVYVVDTENVPVTEYDFVLPDGYANLNITLNDVPLEDKNIKFGWNDGKFGYVPTVQIKNLPINATLKLSYDLPDGAVYQTYKNGSVSVDAVNKIYSFTVVAEELFWYLETEYVTVYLPELQTEYYYFYNYIGNSFNSREQKVVKGADLGFRFTFNVKLTDIERQYEAFCNTMKAEGYTIEFVEADPNGGNVSEYYTHVFGKIKNIVADVELTFEIPEENSYDLRFKVYEDFTYRVDGVDIVPEAGATSVVVTMMQSSSVLTLVPKAGYTFKPGYSDEPKWSFYKALRDGTIKEVEWYSPIGATREPNSFNYQLRMNSYSDAPMVEYNNQMATDAQKLHTIAYKMIPAQWDVEEFKDRYSVTANGGVFETTPSTTVLNNADYTLKLTVPNGETPTMYVEYGDKLAEGFKVVAGVKGTGNQYTFTISKVTTGLRWYILLEVSKYEVQFVYNGETLLQTVVPHGTSLEDISLPTEIEGIKDGQAGMYKIDGWKWSGGSEILLIDKGGTIEPILGTFTPFAAKMNQTYYKTVREAIASLSSYTGTDLMCIDILAYAPAETLTGGQYVIPKNVILRLPYAVDGYGEKLAALSDSPSAMYVNENLGKVKLIIAEGATLEVYGIINIGAIVGYPASGYPWQGHVSSHHAILQLDGKINLRNGGQLQAHGFVTGNGTVEAFEGSAVFENFIVKDYRGGTNSANVFDQNIAPFNVYEMPNIMVETIVHYGASEIAFANLFAMGGYNPVSIEILGAKGLIQPVKGGKIVKNTTKIVNSRYSDATKHRESPYEYRIRLDVYGGGTDGVMELMGLVDTKKLPMAISYIYDIHLHDGNYVLKNGYKIMPGGALTVDKGASLEILFTDGLLGSLTAYGADFRDNFGSYNFNQQLLLYPPIDIAGKFTVNGDLIIRGRLGAQIYTEVAGATIKVYSKDTFLSVQQREGIFLNVADKEFELTYDRRIFATVDGQTLVQGGIYKSKVSDGGNIVWERNN